MVLISIYAYNLKQIHLIERIVNNWAYRSQILVKNTLFLVGKDLVNNCINENLVDIILLNLQEGNYNGIEIVRKIRNNNNKVIIIIITNCNKLVYDAYELGVFRYINEDFLEKKLKIALNDVAEKLNSSHSYFIYLVNGKPWKLFYKEIMYFESKKRIILIHTETEGIKKFYDKLTNIELALDSKEFVRCHQSYIVNIRYIKGFLNNDIILAGNQKIPISSRRKNGLEERFLLVNNKN